jgi:hypothetical protein
VAPAQDGYMGDTAQKNLVLNKKALGELGIPITEHDKLPDVALYDRKPRWLFLVDAVTSHGPDVAENGLSAGSGGSRPLIPGRCRPL